MAAEKDERHYRVAVDRVIQESNTRGYGRFVEDFEEEEKYAREPKERRACRVLEVLRTNNIVLIRPRDLPKAS